MLCEIFEDTYTIVMSLFGVKLHPENMPARDCSAEFVSVKALSSDIFRSFRDVFVTVKKIKSEIAVDALEKWVNLSHAEGIPAHMWQVWFLG